MSDLVGNHKNRFSCDMSKILHKQLQLMGTPEFFYKKNCLMFVPCQVKTDEFTDISIQSSEIWKMDEQRETILLISLFSDVSDLQSFLVSIVKE